MTSKSRFRLTLLLAGIVAVLFSRGFKGLPTKAAGDPKQPKPQCESPQGSGHPGPSTSGGP